MKKLVTVLPVFSAFWFIATIVFGGIAQPNYQHTSQFISELGAAGSANGQIVNLFGFIPTSIMLTGFVLIALHLLSPSRKQVLGLLGIGLYAITLLVAALQPCDAGCRPDNPSLAQDIHNLSAFVGYLGGIVGVFLLATDVKQQGRKRLGNFGYAVGGTTTAMFIMLTPEFSYVGLAQRVFELSMYSWIISYSFCLQDEILSKSRKKDEENYTSP